MKARVAGLFLLLYAATGAAGYSVSQSLMIGNDAAATAANLLSSETAFRLAIGANLLSAACYLVVATLLYDLFRPVDRTIARLAVFFLLISCAIGAFDSLFQYAALDVLQGDPYLGSFNTSQRQSLALLFLHENARALDMGLVFFGFLWITIGYLVMRSTFLPRIIGAIAMFDGLWYLAHLYRPLAVALFPYLVIIPGIGGMVIMLWLMIRGVDAQRWAEQANSAAREVENKKRGGL
jgi:hypothetical protein